MPELKEILENHTRSSANEIIKLNKGINRAYSDPTKPINPGVIEFRSERPTLRELAQQGEFLMPINITQPFEKNLTSLYEAANPTASLERKNITDLDMKDHYDFPLIKFRIPRERFREIYISLRHMNITAASLFPDFEGLTKWAQENITWETAIYDYAF